MDPAVSLHPTVETPPYQTVLTFNSWRKETPRTRSHTPDSQHSGSAHSTPNAQGSTRSRHGRSPYRTDAPKRSRSRRADSRSPPQIRALSSMENASSSSVDYWPERSESRRGRSHTHKYGASTHSKHERKFSQLHKDAWFHIMTFLPVADICAFHGISGTAWRACKLALSRVDRIRLFYKKLWWRTNVLEAVHRGGCGSLQILDVPGDIPIVAKIVQAAPNIEKIKHLAPNLLSRHLDHPLPALTHLTIWIDEHYSDDLSTISLQCQNLLTLRVTATAGMTVYDQQAVLVLRRCTKLQRLCFQGVRVTTDIAEEIQHLKHLQTLRLEDAGITDAEVIALVNNFKTTSLLSLSLKRNPLTPTGVSCIGHNDMLRETLLGLSICGSGDVFAGTFHMVCAPDFLPKLQQLRVASRLVHVFEMQMRKTRPNVEICSRSLGAVFPRISIDSNT